MKVNTPAGWMDATPKKINTPSGWQDVVSVKVNTPGGWKDLSGGAEPEVLTSISWKKTASMTIEFTALGGSGTYFWDFDGDGKTDETAGYGEKVIVHKYKNGGYKTATCMDMAGNSNQQGVKVSVDLNVTN
jgi:hypothetical protein